MTLIPVQNAKKIVIELVLLIAIVKKGLLSFMILDIIKNAFLFHSIMCINMKMIGYGKLFVLIRMI